MLSPVSRLPSPVENKYLSSWKEIAQYLSRGVRTVQRWETELGMPVRRPHGGSRTAVMAIREELDGWMASRPFRETSVLQHNGNANGHQESALVHVLIVEDGNQNIEDGRQASFLKKLGPLLQLDFVCNLESALALLKAIDNGQHPEPDLIVLDQKLFGIIAHQIFRSGHENSRLKNVQILVRPSIFIRQGIRAA